MVGAAQVATWLGIIVATITILSTVKSAYNGYLRAVVNGLLKLDKMCRDMEAFYQRQEDLIDAVIALAVSQRRDEEQPAPLEEIEKRFDREEGPRRFLDESEGSSFVRGGNDD